MNRIRRRGKAIVRELGRACHFDETTPPQVCEMTRDEWLGLLEQLDEIAHTQFSGGQDVQYPQAGRIREGAEERFEVGDGRGGNGGAHSSPGTR